MQNGTPGVFRPQVTHVVSQTVKKGEDVVVAHQSPYQTGTKNAYNLAIFAVADGHNGDAAAQHVREMLCSEIKRHLPSSPPPIAPGTDATKKYAEQLREAVATTFLTLEAQFVLTGQLSGCTLTVAIITDWLLTVGSVGDSKAVLDTGSQFMEVSPEHRVEHHRAEQNRLKAAGTYLAPISIYMDGAAEPDEPGYGPLRAWPGGLCVSRAIGDVDVGENIIAHPHIMQIQIPQEGARLVMASDGLWDCFNSRKVVKMLRSKENHQAGDHISKAAIRRQNGQVADDLSIVIVDMLPHGTTFPDVAAQLTRTNSSSYASSPPKSIKKTSSLKNFFGCGSEPVVLQEFDASFHDPSIRDRSTRGKTGDLSNHCNVNIIADIDSYVEYSHLSPMSVSIKRQLWPAPQTQSPFQHQQADQPSPSSDSSGSTTFMAEDSGMSIEPPAANGSGIGTFRPEGVRPSIDRRSLDRGLAPVSPLYRRSLDNITRTTDMTRTLSKGSLTHDGQPQTHMARQPSGGYVPLERRTSSLGNGMSNVLRTISRGNLGGSKEQVTGSEHVSATHFGGPPTLVPVRGNQPPEKMIVDPTTHAEANFRRRSKPEADYMYNTM